jgi:hypothetical protein
VLQYDSGNKSWFNQQTFGCFGLSKSSRISTYLTLEDAVGGLFRVRANYVRSAGDSSNSNADSGWFYFKVVK